MKNLAKTLGIITAFTIAAFAQTKNVYADGLGVSADKDTCEIGDRIVVTVDAEKVGDGSVPPDIQVEFDARRLNFETCSAEYGGGGGGLVTFKDKKVLLVLSDVLTVLIVLSTMFIKQHSIIDVISAFVIFIPVFIIICFVINPVGKKSKSE